jgi:hypothetical protein
MAKAYLLKGDSYVRFDTATDAADTGYPKRVVNGWSGLAETGFDRDIDCVLDLGNGTACLFKGDACVHVDQTTNAVTGPVQRIAEAWPGLDAAGFAGSLDAVVRWNDTQVFFFKDAVYTSFDLGRGQADEDYLVAIADGWRGLGDVGFERGIDAAVNWENGKIYLFKGDRYVRYDTAADQMDDGYPLSVADGWRGLASLGFADGLDAIWLKLAAAPSGGPDGGAPLAGQLQPGDHVWYYDGHTSTATAIPRTDWFPGSTSETDYLGQGRSIFQFVVYEDHLKRGQPHMLGGPGTFAWLNNNPGNLTAGGVNVGEYPGKRNWHNFLIFPTRQAGFDAIPTFLRANNYGPLGIAAAIRRYAPSGDGRNNPEQYAQSIVDALHGTVTLETRIDALSAEQMLEVQRAIERMEGTVAGDTFARDDPRLPVQVRAMLP